MPVDFSGNHEHNMKQAEAFDAARRATLSAWSKQPPDYDSAVWKGATELGAGSYGAAFVFYREDDDGIVIDRIAVKDTVAKKQEWVRNCSFLIAQRDVFADFDFPGGLDEVVGQS